MLPEPESEIAVGSLFRVTGGALAGGVLLRVPGLQRGRMVPWFLYLPSGGGCAEKSWFVEDVSGVDRFCVACSTELFSPSVVPNGAKTPLEKLWGS